MALPSCHKHLAINLQNCSNNEIKTHTQNIRLQEKNDSDF